MNAFFREKSRVSRRMFSLEGQKLTISGKSRGIESTHVFDLDGVSPHRARFRYRATKVLFILFGVSAFIGIAGWLFSHIDGFPDPVVHWIWTTAAFVAFASLRFIRPFEFVQFYDHDRRLLFDIVREKEQAALCDAFVEKVYAKTSFPNKRTEAEPGATDNPDDAQRLREDH